MTKYCKRDLKGKAKWILSDGVFIVDLSHVAEFRLYHYNSVEVAIHEQ